MDSICGLLKIHKIMNSIDKICPFLKSFIPFFNESITECVCTHSK